MLHGLIRHSPVALFQVMKIHQQCLDCLVHYISEDAKYSTIPLTKQTDALMSQVHALDTYMKTIINSKSSIMCLSHLQMSHEVFHKFCSS